MRNFLRIARLSALVALGLWALAASAPAEEGKLVGLEVKLWDPELSTKFKGSTDDIEGTNIDVDEDLNMDTRDRVPYAKLWFGGSHRVALSAMRLKVDGKTHLDKEITFEGETYRVGETVTTEIAADIYRLAWEADWVSTDYVRVGTILGVDYFDASASIKSQTTGLHEEGDGQVPVPVIGLIAEVQLVSGISAYGEVAGVYADYGGVSGKLIEAEAGLKLDISGHAHMSVGWRYMALGLEDDDNKFEMSFSGVIVGLGVRF